MRKKSAQVVLVDDDHDFLNETREYIERLGHEVVTYENAIEALGFLQSGSPNLIILDIDMPEIDGIRAADICLSLNPKQKLFIISGSTRLINKVRNMNFFPDEVFLKPLPGENFFAKLNAYLV